MGDLLFPFGRDRRGGGERDTALDRLRDTEAATDRFSRIDPDQLVEVPVDWMDEALADTPDLAPETDVHGAAVTNIEPRGPSVAARFTGARAPRTRPALRVGCQEQTWPQIAERLGVCEKTAHNLKKRGLDRLRAAWLEPEIAAAALSRRAMPRLRSKPHERASNGWRGGFTRSHACPVRHVGQRRKISDRMSGPMLGVWTRHQGRGRGAAAKRRSESSEQHLERRALSLVRRRAAHRAGRPVGRLGVGMFPTQREFSLPANSGSGQRSCDAAAVSAGPTSWDWRCAPAGPSALLRAGSGRRRPSRSGANRRPHLPNAMRLRELGYSKLATRVTQTGGARHFEARHGL